MGRVNLRVGHVADARVFNLRRRCAVEGSQAAGRLPGRALKQLAHDGPVIKALMRRRVQHAVAGSFVETFSEGLRVRFYKVCEWPCAWGPRPAYRSRRTRHEDERHVTEDGCGHIKQAVHVTVYALTHNKAAAAALVLMLQTHWRSKGAMATGCGSVAAGTEMQ